MNFWGWLGNTIINFYLENMTFNLENDYDLGKMAIDFENYPTLLPLANSLTLSVMLPSFKSCFQVNLIFKLIGTDFRSTHAISLSLRTYQ